MTMTRAEIRERGKQVRWIFNQVCRTVLPYLVDNYDERTETVATKLITRFCYVAVGVDGLYEDNSAAVDSGNFRDTLSADQLHSIMDEELRISKKLIALPYQLTAKVNRPSDILNYLA